MNSPDMNPKNEKQQQPSRRAVQVFTDGSSLGNPGPGGWAWWRHEQCWAAGSLPHTTNQQAELVAILMALKHVPPHLPLDVVSDSQYGVNVVTKWLPTWRRNGWRTASRQPVQNLKLIQHLDTAIRARTIPASVRWVRGHNGVAGNERADRAAVAAAYAEKGGRVVQAGPGWVPGSKPKPKPISQRRTGGVSRTRPVRRDSGKTPALVQRDNAAMGVQPDTGLVVAKCSSCGATLHPLSLDCRCTR